MTAAELRCVAAWAAGLVALTVAVLEWRDQHLPTNTRAALRGDQ